MENDENNFWVSSRFRVEEGFSFWGCFMRNESGFSSKFRGKMGKVVGEEFNGLVIWLNL